MENLADHWAVVCFLLQRATINAVSYEVACEKNQEKTGKKLSRQTFNILPKIKEIDDPVRGCAKARLLIREVHPEICFWALNKWKPMDFKKKEPEGIKERLTILERIRPSVRREFNTILECFRRRDVGRDDILDAMVASVTASADSSALCTLPSQVKRDDYELPMEMVYISMSNIVGKFYDAT